MVSKESHRVTVTAEVIVELKVAIKEKVHAGTVEPATHLEDVLPLERHVTIVVGKDTIKPFADFVNSLTEFEFEQDESQNDWIFSLNQEGVVIQFTDSVTKVKGSHNIMFNEIEISRVLVDLKVQAALHKN